MNGVPGNASAERLGWAIFIAAAAHALAILGLGFAPPQPIGPAEVPTLEVTLLDAPLPDQPAPEDAQYLAQASQEGAGNVEDQLRPELYDRPPAEEEAEPAEPTPEAPDAQLIATWDSWMRAAIAPLTAAEESQSVEMPPEGGVSRVTAIGEREHFVSVNARESVFAEYLAGWKARMERLGTVNFPNLPHHRSGDPVLEVAVAADGSLREVRVTRSSGNGALDQAAMDLVRLASPYDPFPATVRAQFEVLRFAYEWRFIDGQASGGRLRAPER